MSEPTRLDKVLALSPIPYFGEKSSYKWLRHLQMTNPHLNERMIHDEPWGKTLIVRSVTYMGYLAVGVIGHDMYSLINELIK